MEHGRYQPSLLKRIYMPKADNNKRLRPLAMIENTVSLIFAML